MEQLGILAFLASVFKYNSYVVLVLRTGKILLVLHAL